MANLATNLTVIPFENPKSKAFRLVGMIRDPRVFRRFKREYGFKSQRIRKNFKTETDAIAAKNKIEEFARLNQTTFHHVKTTLSPDTISEVERLVSIIPDGVTLSDVIRRGIRDSVESPTKTGSLRKLLDKYRQEKVDEKKRERTVSSFYSELDRFLRFSRAKVPGDITRETAYSFIFKPVVKAGREQPCSGKTTIARRRYLNEFCDYLKRDGYLSGNPVTNIEPAKDEYRIPQILTPSTARELILSAIGDEKTRGAMVGYYVISLFTGVRRSEYLQLTRSAFSMDEDPTFRELLVVRQKQKKAAPRLIPIRENLFKWLRWLDEKRLPWICFDINDDRRIRNRVGLEPWSIDGRRENPLRKSFISYSIASGLDRKTVAEQSGNSVEMIEEEYLAFSTSIRRQSEAFWGSNPNALGIA